MAAVTATILSAGRPMDPTVELLSIDIHREVDRIPHAELRVLDGSSARRQFAVSTSQFFEPGADIQIKLRHEGADERTVFRGLVVRHGVEVGHAGSILVVRLKDAAVRLTGVRQSAVFRDTSDAAVVKKLLSRAGVKAGMIAETTVKHPEMVQCNCTPWDFILSRADALGLLVVVEDGEVSLRKMAIEGPAVHRFEYGVDEIFELELEADAEHQQRAVESIAWDMKGLKPTTPRKAKVPGPSPGNLDGGKLGSAVGRDTCTLAHWAPVPPDELQAWADAVLARSRMSLLRGRLAVPGFAGLKTLDVMEISGVGERFDGKTLVTGLRQRVDSAGWRTDVQFGLPPEAFARREHILDVPASGLLPAASGLHVGVVAEFEADPEDEVRVKVLVPGLDRTKSVWARLAAPDAGKARGYFFRPEPGDEVIVGFLYDDPRRPVILGSLFGSKNAPPEALGKPSKENARKGIVTRKGTVIQFEDGDGAAVLIKTPGGATLRLDDAEGTVSLSDKNNNAITLDANGMTLKSAKALKIEAKGTVEIKGVGITLKDSQGLKIDASGAVEIKGSKVDIK